MSQSYVMPAKAFETMEQHENLLRKQLIGDSVHATEVFTGPRIREVKEAMDVRLKEVEALGGKLTHRTAIGRNAPCPCGSGLKFKKCCIGKAAMVG
jgi:uncharacterized protein YecA (UPF0149 family)